MPCRTHFSESWMQRSIISNEKVSYLYLGVLPENSWMSFLHSTSHYSLRKSLKDLSDHLNFFVSCQGRSQLSPAIFRASRNHLVASKHSYMLKLSKSAVSQRSVKANLTHDLIYICWVARKYRSPHVLLFFTYIGNFSSSKPFQKL